MALNHSPRILSTLCRTWGDTAAKVSVAHFSTSRPVERDNYKVLILGGGTGGCATANTIANKLGKDELAIVDPADWHYYQPFWTLVGAGAKTFHQSGRRMETVLPKKANWIKEKVASIDPDNCLVTTNEGREIGYEYLVVALGIQLNYDKIPGLVHALRNDMQVSSNYWKEYVVKTRLGLDAVQEGNAIFTFPNTPIKCAGAPQKIMYLADDLFRKQGKRDRINIIYNTSLPVIFGVKKYANVLNKIVEERNLQVNLRHNLVEVFPETREAMFEQLDTGEKKKMKYSFMHVTPPQSATDVVRNCKQLVDDSGWIDIDKESMQSTRYPNVFAVGDNINAPTAKTAASCPEQVQTAVKNIVRLMKGREDLIKGYTGYASCPLVTSYNKCVMAEFGYGKDAPTVLETFPINQAKERRTMFMMKKYFMPELYWYGLLPGWWPGPKLLRKALHLGRGN